mmetsp:Transcript_7007/g.13348  ORF Transcript_7007/g.13348 Transcript_7007/m.13348 type:complete len:676 (+) Transcript_7007:58-2085(+)
MAEEAPEPIPDVTPEAPINAEAPIDAPDDFVKVDNEGNTLSPKATGEPAMEVKAEPAMEKKEEEPPLPTLKAQPSNPLGKITLIECRGGSDKAKDGHRKDSIPICNAIIDKGWECKLVYYSDAEFEAVEAEIMSSKGYICRVNPGTYEGVTQSRLDGLLDAAVKKGVKGMSSPESMKKMGAKDALVKINKLRCGMPSTAAYYDMKELEAGFTKTMATGDTRVLKQNRGSQGEGIWVCKLAEGEDAKIKDGKCPPDTLLDLQEAVDNHTEKKTIGDFMAFCKTYLDGENGLLVDQKFLPRIVEGEVRVFMIGDSPIELIHKKPKEGGISATMKSGAKYVRYEPDDKKYELLMSHFKEDLPVLMEALEIGDQPLPLIWTGDFIPGPAKDGKDTFFVGEFNCSCVGITKQLHLAEKVALAAIKVCSEETKEAKKEPKEAKEEPREEPKEEPVSVSVTPPATEEKGEVKIDAEEDDDDDEEEELEEPPQGTIRMPTFTGNGDAAWEPGQPIEEEESPLLAGYDMKESSGGADEKHVVPAYGEGESPMDFYAKLERVPYVTKIAEQYELKPLYVVIGAVSLTVLVLLMAMGATALVNVVCYCYPLYLAMLATKVKKPGYVKQWLTYFIMFGAFAVFEAEEPTLFFLLVKAVVLIWGFLPGVYGATKLVNILNRFGLVKMD